MILKANLYIKRGQSAGALVHLLAGYQFCGCLVVPSIVRVVISIKYAVLTKRCYCTLLLFY